MPLDGGDLTVTIVTIASHRLTSITTASLQSMLDAGGDVGPLRVPKAPANSVSDAGGL